MADTVTLVVDGRPRPVPAGATVASALLGLGVESWAADGGRPRAPLCGMGTCFECRVKVDGVAHRRGCRVLCREGMTVETGGV